VQEQFLTLCEKGQEKFRIIKKGQAFDKGKIFLPTTHLGLKS
jgi:hypothetical protein